MIAITAYKYYLLHISHGCKFELEKVPGDNNAGHEFCIVGNSWCGVYDCLRKLK